VRTVSRELAFGAMDSRSIDFFGVVDGVVVRDGCRSRELNPAGLSAFLNLDRMTTHQIGTRP
jgi:hypothetical protein